jgi:uncharacterized membrane protein
VELKVGIPLGIHQGVHPVLAVFLGIVGTMIQLPFNLLVLRLLISLAERFPAARRFLVSSRYRSRKHRPMIRRYGIFGVALLVAIPVPGTGLFTGTVAGSLIGLGNRSLAVGLAVGTAVAGILVGLAATGVLHLLP